MADISGYLNNIRSAESGETVRDSIIQCLNKINKDNPNQTKPLNVTANGTYTSETGFSYNPVTVNVPSGGQSGYTFEELEVTENGEYEPDEDNKMFNKVTVNVPQLAKDLAPDGYTITQNGEYDPLLDGYDGYGKIIVNVNEKTGDGPFTVEFYNKPVTDPSAALIHTETVNKYGSVAYTALDGTTNGQGQWFKGWSPDPVNVTRDLKCYPVYSDIVIDPTEISDTWDQICANGGAPYPIGAHKSLYIEVPEQTWSASPSSIVEGTPVREIDGKRCYPRGRNNKEVYIARTGFLLDMVKVAQGESGSTSTWLSKNPTYANVSDSDRALYIGSAGDTANGCAGWGDIDNYGYVVNRFDWGNSAIRTYLHEKFMPCMPTSLQSTIKAVSKTYYGSLNYIDITPAKAFKQSSDKIWIPSIAELKTFFNSKELSSGYSSILAKFRDLLGIETGIDYTTNYEDIGLIFSSNGVCLRDHTDNEGSYNFTLGSGNSCSIAYTFPCIYFSIGFCL